jgi:hypothetical protein
MKKSNVRRYKMKQKYTIGILAIAMVALLGAGMVSAFGSGTGLFNILNKQNMTQVHEQQQALQTAINNNDYNSWKSLMEQQISKMQALVTQDNFNTLVEQNTKVKTIQEQQQSLQTAIKNNDYDSWASIMQSKITEDNFNQEVARFQQMQSMKGNANPKSGNYSKGSLSADQKALQTAIENNDYTTWKSLMTSRITQANFQKAVDQYSKMQTHKGMQRKGNKPSWNPTN